MEPNRKKSASCEVCILAGGLSSRLGRDKAKLRLGGRTLLARAIAAAAPLEFPTRVIRRDLVLRCGPLGGVYTALETTHAQSILFLSCDMPFVPTELLLRLLSSLRARDRGVFVAQEGIVGFPFLLRVGVITDVQALLRKKQFSLQGLSGKLKARVVCPARGEAGLLVNVNSSEDWITARKFWKKLRAQRL